MQFTEDELSEILSRHAAWVKGEGGERADLSGTNLSDANLSGANLSGVNLTGADLSRANLTGAIRPKGFTPPETPETEPVG